MESILLDAKKEYSKQLVGFLTPALYDELYFLWKKAVDDDSKSPMRRYQDLLEEIAEWDESKKLQITDRCIEKSGCKFLEDLLTAVFVAHTKVLMSIRNKSNVSKESYKLQVPTSNRFVYECLVQCARDFWKSPYLFYQNEADNKIDKIQIQKNLRIAEGNVKDSVMETIRNLLPIKDVLGSVLEMNEEGGVVVDIASHTGKETLMKESVKKSLEEESKEEPVREVEVEVEVKDEDANKFKTPASISHVKISQEQTLKEIQGGLGREKPLSFKEAELGNLTATGSSKLGNGNKYLENEAEVETDLDDYVQPLEEETKVTSTETTRRTGGEDEGDVGDENQNERDEDESGFDWNSIIVGPVDETIESSLQGDIESLDPPNAPSEVDMNDILGAVEEL